MSYTFVEAVVPLLYDDFVKQHKHCNILQSSNWAKVKANWRHHLTGLHDASGNLVAAGLVLVRYLPLGQSMWYLPYGPVLDYTDAAVRDAYLEGLKAWAMQKQVTFVRIHPPIARRSLYLNEYPGTPDPKSMEQLEALEALGYIHQGFSDAMDSTIQPRFSAVTFNRDDFVPSLPGRTQRALRDAMRRQARIRREGRSALDEFVQVIEATEAHKAISLRNKAYFELIWDAFGDEHTYLYLARIDVSKALETAQVQLQKTESELADCPASAPKKRRQLQVEQEAYQNRVDFLQERLEASGTDQVIAGALGVEYGTAFELLYAGRNPEFRQIPAQDAIYVEAMRSAFARGKRYVSTGGVPGSLDDGLTRFKSDFNPHFVETLGEFDYPVKPLRYRGAMTALKIRRKTLP